MPTLGDIVHFVRCQFFGSTVLPNADFSGKTIIVTGANTGLGFDAALHIARMNAAQVILACRSVEKAEAAAIKIRSDKSIRSSTTVSVWQVDLDSHASVVSFITRARTLPRLDGVICNAGVELDTFHTSEGLEQTVNVNIVSTFMIAQGVLHVLKETAAREDVDTRLTIVGSLIHVFGPDAQMEVSPDKTVLKELSAEKSADMAQRYPLSKLMVHLCFNELVEGLKDDKEGKGKVIVNLVNPGWCGTELSRARKADFFERTMFNMIGRTSEEGSRTLVHGVAGGRETHGKYLSECQVKPQSSYVQSQRGHRMQKRLWGEVSERIQSRMSKAA